MVFCRAAAASAESLAGGGTSAKSQSDSAAELPSLESVTNGGREGSEDIRETDPPHAPGRVVPATTVGPAGWREGFEDELALGTSRAGGSAPVAPGMAVPHGEPSAGAEGAEPSRVRGTSSSDEAARAAIGDVRL